MNLRQLEAFRAVMVSGSVTQAAKAMNLSQPAVSKLIAELEHALGFRLFLRAKGSVLTVTPEAEFFFHEVERSFLGIEALKRTARDIRELSTGHLRIAALPALAVSFLPRVIRAYRERYPAITIQLQTRSSSTVRQWIANQQFDLGLATRARDMPGITMERFMRCAGACVLPPGHRLAGLDMITPKDLEGEPFISLALEDPTRRRVDLAFEDAGVERQMVIETQYAMAICGLVLEGVGCSILNPVTARDFASRGLVVRPFIPRISFEYMLFRPSLRPASQAADRFVELMIETRDAMVAEGALGDPV
ncbi:LysR substrate-binding domain-containing protein [Sphingomonas koreensis]|uniref:LysR substrate-binding domain-containing protein n=1 Tax=Sphingomonas koreensis TaxID=93064 RepID=UPI00234EE545|nr:LysR substrate-binding domain-containing protein [Sphingomonas koreensis]MDC7810165.1 LysR substrate-binding domain-containing protein [Sphingomonas koreensis]